MKPLSHVLNEIRPLLSISKFFVAVYPTLSAGGVLKLRLGEYPSLPRHLIQHRETPTARAQLTFLAHEVKFSRSLIGQN